MYGRWAGQGVAITIDNERLQGLRLAIIDGKDSRIHDFGDLLDNPDKLLQEIKKIMETPYSTLIGSTEHPSILGIRRQLHQRKIRFGKLNPVPELIASLGVQPFDPTLDESDRYEESDEAYESFDEKDDAPGEKDDVPGENDRIDPKQVIRTQCPLQPRLEVAFNPAYQSTENSHKHQQAIQAFRIANRDVSNDIQEK
ncbi:hypothetical protein FALBO_5272 [Fusarium albosuccineum]|uniref:Uncharacterized protein n=1 Tax=Fusarium albosuccineum TaxID=1237068 RepID=A0A8H4LEC6_9HYPO|nr:hypothetical protein FALBO_5272 [Fusarium albosuccineum]